MRVQADCPRRGMALMALVVSLAILSVMMSAATWQIIAYRRSVERRVNQEQALWLARAGIERAVGRLLANLAGDASESLELIPQSKLQVTVRREPRQADTYHVISESHFPTDSAHPVVRVETRLLRRTIENGVARITALRAEEDDNHDKTK